MEQLLGRKFSLEDVNYAIVDVRNINGETMVYAEPQEPVSEALAKGPQRAAFRYSDIQPRLVVESAVKAASN